MGGLVSSWSMLILLAAEYSDAPERYSMSVCYGRAIAIRKYQPSTAGLVSGNCRRTMDDPSPVASADSWWTMILFFRRL